MLKTDRSDELMAKIRTHIKCICMKDVMHIGSADDEMQCTAVSPVEADALLADYIVP